MTWPVGRENLEAEARQRAELLRTREGMRGVQLLDEDGVLLDCSVPSWSPRLVV